MWFWLLSTALASPGACLDGQHRPVLAVRECCWAGQRWSRQDDVCMGIPRKCPEGWSVQLGPPDNPRAAICDDISPAPFQLDEDGELLGLPGRVDAWGADPRLGPALAWGEPEIDGDLAKHRIDDVLRSHRAELAACSELVRADRATATGVVRVHWRIDRKGRTYAVRVRKNTLRHHRTRACLVSTVRDMTFSEPVSGDSVGVAYTFVVGEYR